MLCGTGSFKHVDEDATACGGGGGSPRERRKQHQHGGGKANPYAARGLDKFSTVLSELQSRRDKILRRVGSDTSLVMVRFAQTDAGWAPIVVKLPGNHQLKADAGAGAKALAVAAAPGPASPREGAVTAQARRAASFSWARMRRPACYWPAVMALTLVCLAMFGRVFAICCTSIWWYLVPALAGGCSDRAGALRRSMEHRRVVSSPPSQQQAKTARKRW